MQSFCHEVASEFFATNAPDPPRWALNSCFVVSRSVWMHFGLFCYCTMLDTKRAALVQLMQKLVPRSRIGFFRNECTRSTPSDPKLTFLCISYYLGPFGTVWLPYETRCKTGRTSAKVRATKSRRNFLKRTHPIHPIGPKTDVLVRFVLFGCRPFGCLTKLGAKQAELEQKFVPRSHVEHSATNAPDPPHWIIY